MTQLTKKSTCRQKRTYHTQATATRAKKRRNKAAGYDYLRTYQCNVCNLWHVTAQVQESAPPQTRKGYQNEEIPPKH
jgi:hypothetical protein